MSLSIQQPELGSTLQDAIMLDCEIVNQKIAFCDDLLMQVQEAADSVTKTLSTVIDLTGEEDSSAQRERRKMTKQKNAIVRDGLSQVRTQVNLIAESNNKTREANRELQLLLDDANARIRELEESAHQAKPKKDKKKSAVANKLRSSRKGMWARNQLGELIENYVITRRLHSAEQLTDAVVEWVKGGDNTEETMEATIVKQKIVEKYGSVDCTEARTALVGQITRQLKNLFKKSKLMERKDGRKNVYFAPEPATSSGDANEDDGEMVLEEGALADASMDPSVASFVAEMEAFLD